MDTPDTPDTPDSARLPRYPRNPGYPGYPRYPAIPPARSSYSPYYTLHTPRGCSRALYGRGAARRISIITSSHRETWLRYDMNEWGISASPRGGSTGGVKILKATANRCQGLGAAGPARRIAEIGYSRVCSHLAGRLPRIKHTAGRIRVFHGVAIFCRIAPCSPVAPTSPWVTGLSKRKEGERWMRGTAGRAAVAS